MILAGLLANSNNKILMLNYKERHKTEVGIVDKFKKIDLKPTQILILGFLGVIVIGTILLALPIASRNGQSVGFIDALFTATSAVCVTGLVVVNTFSHWTFFGKTVILVLIQIGGLGVMTLATTFFILLGRKIGFRERLLMQESLNHHSVSGIIRLTRNIFIGTVIIESVGAVLLSFRFIPEYGLMHGIFKSIFHSVSAFCNAGFDIIGFSSLTDYVTDPLVNLTIIFLIVVGGLGFNVWMDLLRVTKLTIKKKRNASYWFLKLSLHTKIVLVVTGILIAFGFVFFLASEGWNDATLGNLSPGGKVLGALFQSVTTRTAGFNTIPLDRMGQDSQFLTVILMFIGGSPAGTAGGVKTVTIGVLYIAVLAIIRAKEEIEIFDRRISMDVIKRALAVIIISLNVVILVTIILSITESTTFINVFFEAVSAFATVGLSLGITGDLSTIGKIIISITMFIGRLGPMTMAVGFAMRHQKKQVTIRKPEEKIMVG